MKTIHDYEEPIKKILEKDFDVSRYEVHEEGLQFDLEYGIHKMNSVLDVDWKNTFNGIYKINSDITEEDHQKIVKWATLEAKNGLQIKYGTQTFLSP